MNFDALKEQLLDRLRQIWGQIRESSLYIELREKYEEMSPGAQKAVTAAGVGIALLIVFAIPLSNLSSSMTNVASFEESKQTLRDLLVVQRELAQTPDVPPAPPADQIKQRVQTILNDAGLAPEQIHEVKDVDTKADPPTALIPPSVQQHGVTATLMKLNLKQVTDIAYQIQSIATNAFLTSMDMTANKEDNHYYDVIYRVVGFSVEDAGEPGGNTAAGGPPPGAGGFKAPIGGKIPGFKPPPPPGKKNL
jgi:hypothetical protein